MIKTYVIESVASPGSFWCKEHNAFKGWLYATSTERKVGYNITSMLEKAIKIGPCKITTVYL